MALKALSVQVPEGAKGQGGILSLVVAVLFFLALALFLVWLNIERTKLAYRLQGLQTEVEARLELQSKLLVERDHLLSPKQLGVRAANLGLQIAKPGQIRRMEGVMPAKNSTAQGEKGKTGR